VPSIFRFRLYPNPEQEKKMLSTIEVCGRLWNDALIHRKRRWEQERQSTTYNLQAWILTAERKNDLQLGGVYSQVTQDTLKRLDRAFKAFFKHKARYPRLKWSVSGGSFTYPQAYNGSVRPDMIRKRLYLAKIGNVKTVYHRQLPKEAMLKTCTVVLEPCGEWYASMVFEDVVPLQGIEVPKERFDRLALRPIGIDLGLKALITTSDGEEIPHPRFLRRTERRLKRLQGNLSRKRSGSANRWKARKRFASMHARVARQRNDFNHKLSKKLVTSHNLIGFEDLRIRNMVRNHSLAKSILDAGWGQLIKYTAYKAAANGILVVSVDPARSTQECSLCGALNRVSLDMRNFDCVGCGKTIRRDQNAAKIVLKRAIAQVGQGMPELKPVETGPLSVLVTERASPVVEAGTAATNIKRWWMSHTVRGG
jgi:putative transposase